MLLLLMCLLTMYLTSVVTQKELFESFDSCAFFLLVILTILIVFKKLLIKIPLSNFHKESPNSKLLTDNLEKLLNKDGYLILEIFFYFIIGLFLLQVFPNARPVPQPHTFIISLVSILIYDIVLACYTYKKQSKKIRGIFFLLIYQETKQMIKAFSTFCVIALLLSDSLMLFMFGVIAICIICYINQTN